MMGGWADSHKPAAPSRVHLLAAALMWTVVGASLLSVGALWSWRLDSALTPVLVVAATVVGVVKSRFVLDRAARRIVRRIRSRGDGRCLGGFLSLPTWVLVAAMAAVGRLLRAGIVAPWVVGLLYVAVGTALLLSSRLIWQGWRSTA
jgi:hypothetical protein